MLGACTALAVYAGIALLANYPDWPGDPGRIRAGDLDMMVWNLAWIPHAISHWQNVFATNWLNYPAGANLAQNTSVPLLGLLTAPLTIAVNPLASLNLLQWLAYPLSAFSMFYVLRRWAGWGLAAFVGGALYGFSPYVVTQGLDHLHMVFVPLPPLILLAAYEAIRPDADHTLRWGVALGALLVAQVYISAEVAATSVLIIAVCAVVLTVANPGEVMPALRRGGQALALAAFLALAGAAYPVWMIAAGPYRYDGAAFPGGVSADLLSSIAPTPFQELAPHGLASAGSHLIFGNLTENGGYLGIPLLLLLGLLVALCWSNRWIRFAAAAGILTTILSLGSRLTVDNHVTPIPLPWALLHHLPFADNIIAARLSLYTDLFAALIVALGMTDLRVRFLDGRTAQRARMESKLGNTRTQIPMLCVLGALALLSVLSLLPAWPLQTAPADVPPFFTSAAVNRIPFGSVALISPYPSVAEVQPQAWQAIAKMRFRIIGGYELVRGPGGSFSDYPQVLRPEAVQRFLWAKATGGPPYPAGSVPSDDGKLVCQLRSFLMRYRVGTVISTAAEAGREPIDTLYTQAMGPPSYVGGGATVWFRVGALLGARSPQCRS